MHVKNMGDSKTRATSKQENSGYMIKGLFTKYIDKILEFFEYLPPCIDIFYGMNVDKPS